jgi:hypothetical protein
MATRPSVIPPESRTGVASGHAQPTSTEAAAVLEKLRTRLLDLTLSNRLLNFKQDGARVVRVIDELPDQLFKRLRDGVELEIVPLPRPPKDEGGAEGSAPAPRVDRAKLALAHA